MQLVGKCLELGLEANDEGGGDGETPARRCAVENRDQHTVHSGHQVALAEFCQAINPSSTNPQGAVKGLGRRRERSEYGADVSDPLDNPTPPRPPPPPPLPPENYG